MLMSVSLQRSVTHLFIAKSPLLGNLWSFLNGRVVDRKHADIMNRDSRL
ncbi:unnamed protein product [Tenebrio molitor]|nr:unnamed protein product [Tenebrio molitor]